MRPFKESDLEQYMDLLNDVGTLTGYSSIRLKSAVDVKREFADTGFLGEHRGRLLIVAPDGRMVGIAGYFPSHALYDGFEVGYRIFRRDDMGKGYASDALRTLVGYMFNSRYFNRLQITFIAGHEASEKVALKCGFSREGVARGASTANGIAQDVVVYSLLRREFDAL